MTRADRVPKSSGRSAMRSPEDSSVLIAGVVRNCAQSVRADIRRLVSAAKIFRSTRILVVESDSDDDTLLVLERMIKEFPLLRIISEGRLQPRMPLRTERIAHCRNVYLSELRTNSLYSSVDYLVVADLDGANARISPTALASCWQPSVREWDVCTANQAGPYYDIWALRHPVWCPDDCWQAYRSLAESIGTTAAAEMAVYSRMIRIARDTPPIPVRSAFGGLAVYRAAVLRRGGRYCGLRSDGTEMCEHVPLHELLVDGGARIVINPTLINAGVTVHARRATSMGRIRRAVRSAAKRILLRVGWGRAATVPP